MLLYLARHGQTDYNRADRIQGQLDIPLNEVGRAQAVTLAERSNHIRFDRILSSNLCRALQTAEAVRARQGVGHVLVDESLTERHWGHLQGEVWRDHHVVPADGESEECLFNRLKMWLRQLIEAHTPTSSPTDTPEDIDVPLDQSDNVLVVTHQDCILMLLKILTQPTGPDSPVRASIGPDVDVSRPFGNTAVAIVRIWWEAGGEGVGELQPMGRLEAWGVGDNLE